MRMLNHEMDLKAVKNVRPLLKELANYKGDPSFGSKIEGIPEEKLENICHMAERTAGQKTGDMQRYVLARATDETIPPKYYEKQLFHGLNALSIMYANEIQSPEEFFSYLEVLEYLHFIETAYDLTKSAINDPHLH